MPQKVALTQGSMSTRSSWDILNCLLVFASVLSLVALFKSHTEYTTQLDKLTKTHQKSLLKNKLEDLNHKLNRRYTDDSIQASMEISKGSVKDSCSIKVSGHELLVKNIHDACSAAFPAFAESFLDDTRMIT